MILKRLLSAIFESNGVLIATSNRSPDDLYYGGLNRDIFLPFIPYIKSKCHILNI
jgi:predicted ATPase